MKKEYRKTLPPVEQKLEHETLRHSPVDEKEIQKLLRGEKAMLISIYKNAGTYTPWTAIITHITYAFDRVGITISYMQGACISLILATALIVGAILSTCLMLNSSPVRHFENVVIHHLHPHHKANGHIILNNPPSPFYLYVQSFPLLLGHSREGGNLIQQSQTIRRC